MKELPNNYIVSLKHIKIDDETYKTVIESAERCYGKLLINQNEHIEAYNDIEPFAPLTHVYFIPTSEYEKSSNFIFEFENKSKKSDFFDERGDFGFVNLNFKEIDVCDTATLINNDDHHIEIQKIDSHKLCQGAEYLKIHAADSENKPTVMFALIADSQYITVHTGTPDDGYEYIGKKQTVKGEAFAAIANEHNVIAAFNADFFDMFGDCKPSGVCIKNSKIISGENSKRPFFGVLNDNTPVISNFSKNPEYREKLKSAVSGREIFLHNRKINELSLLESFSYVRHPRTAAAILNDGRFMILVVDGRLPDYSNGASIVDLARIMQNFGAKDAINLDGGGSSTFLIKRNDDFLMLNTPADLHQPTDHLIREVFDSILLTKIN